MKWKFFKAPYLSNGTVIDWVNQQTNFGSQAPEEDVKIGEKK